MRFRSFLLALLLFWAAGSTASAQYLPQARIAADSVRRPLPNPAVVGLLSAAVPGAGQYVLGMHRWVPMLAAEAFGWWEYRGQRRDGHAFENRYKALACAVPRRVSAGGCPDTTNFQYYEDMAKVEYTGSGSFDANPTAAGLQPETDPETLNGSVWALAQSLYHAEGAAPGSPEYQAALAYYEQNAIPAAYAWAWGENVLEQEVFRRLIRRSDDSFRRASRTLGLVLANHVVSAVDALVTARLRQMTAGAGIQLHDRFEPDGDALRWTMLVRWTPGPAR